MYSDINKTSWFIFYSAFLFMNKNKSLAKIEMVRHGFSDLGDPFPPLPTPVVPQLRAVHCTIAFFSRYFNIEFKAQK